MGTSAVTAAAATAAAAAALISFTLLLVVRRKRLWNSIHGSLRFQRPSSLGNSSRTDADTHSSGALGAGVIQCIGNTPLIRLHSLSAATSCEIWAKAEFLNPGGSVKDRVALSIIQNALASGQLSPGGLVTEGSAGSTGVSLAMVAAAYGCRCFVAMPDDAATEKSDVLVALGAEVQRVRPVSIAHPEHFVNVARRRAEAETGTGTGGGGSAAGGAGLGARGPGAEGSAGGGVGTRPEAEGSRVSVASAGGRPAPLTAAATAGRVGGVSGAAAEVTVGTAAAAAAAAGGGVGGSGRQTLLLRENVELSIRPKCSGIPPPSDNPSEGLLVSSAGLVSQKDLPLSGGPPPASVPNGFPPPAPPSDILADQFEDKGVCSETLNGKEPGGRLQAHLAGQSSALFPDRLDTQTGATAHVGSLPSSLPREVEKGSCCSPSAFFADQFENSANFEAHYRGTGREIWEQLGRVTPQGKEAGGGGGETRRRVDAFVAAAGTGGTIAGVSCYLKDRDPATLCFLIDPPGSSLFNYVTRGVLFSSVEAEGKRLKNPVDTITEGIGINRMTGNLKRARIDGAFRGTDREAVQMARFLLKHEGLFVGSSSAMNCVGAVRAAQKLGSGHTIVTILCDGGARHLSKFHNEAYLRAVGLEPREEEGLGFLGLT